MIEVITVIAAQVAVILSFVAGRAIGHKDCNYGETDIHDTEDTSASRNE